MIRFAPAARRRRLSLALGTSTLACGLFLPAAAHAQCAPDPTQANGTTTCTGLDEDGVRVTTAGTTLAVAANASVTNAGAPAVAVEVPHGAYTSSTSDAITVAGAVSASGQNAITVSSGAPYASGYYSSQYLTLTVAPGGTVTGGTALALLQTAGNPTGTVSAVVDNAGTLTGTSGVALSGNVTSTTNGYTSLITSLSTITNRAGASIIGGIVGPVGTLTNAGLIDGGEGAALNMGNANPYSYATLTNTGTIRSTGATAITSTGGALTLTNTGTITGNVSSTGGYSGSTVDSTAGTINGNVIFGDTNDTLIARYTGSRTLSTGITGTVDGGRGTNTEQVIFDADTVVSTPIDLATNFQRLALAPASKVTVTLDRGFSTSTGVVLAGNGGAVVNRGTIAASGQSAVTDSSTNGYSGVTSFTNAGEISTTGAGGYYAVSLGYASNITNSGTINSSGGGIANSAYGITLANTGSITALGTGVNGFDADATNTGSITSTGGTGVVVNGNVGLVSSNAGTIGGQTAGVETAINYTNTGTISSAGTGVIVDAYGYLINAAGGVVNGGSRGAVSVGFYSAGVANAGTINGNVALSDGYSSGGGATFVALPGGVLNGNLAVGAYGTFLTDLANAGPGQFAGVTGTVTAGTGAALRYRVASDTTAMLGAVGPFATAGYQLSGNASLTLTAPATQTRTLVLAGGGTVDLSADFTMADASAIQSTAGIGYPGAPAASTALTITSHGALAATRTASGYFGGVVALGSSDTFTNAGTIRLADHTSYPVAAIYGGSSVTNAGAITLDGAVGISGSATNIINTGSIVQAAGGAAAQGVVGATSLNNSGTISVGGTAVQIYPYDYAPTITNSGTIASTGGIAITTGSGGYGQVAIANQAGGTITGAGRAIQVFAGTLTNAGTITGTVDLGYASATSRGYASSVYVADGGTIAGDLLFGSSSDVFVAMDDVAGVSGTIDGGAGTDLYIHALRITGTVTIGALAAKNFEQEGVRALGSGTVATIAAAAPVVNDIYLSGDGSIINKATINGSVIAGSYYNDPTSGTAMLASFENQGTLNSFSGPTQHFANGGSIGLDTLQTSAVAISQAGALDFSNSGQITNALDASYSGYYDPIYAQPVPAVILGTQDALTILNTGQITGGLDASASTAGLAQPTTAVPTIAMTNTGTITGGTLADTVALGLAARGGTGSALAAVTLTNSGTIQTSAVSGLGVALTAFNGASQAGQAAVTLTNSGTISANGGGTYRAATSNFYYQQPAYTDYSAGLLVASDIGTKIAVTNAAGGTIEATGAQSVALLSFTGDLTLANAGTIRGGSGTTLDAGDSLAGVIGSPYLAGAIQTAGGNNSISNTGTITGSIALGDGIDTVENRGTITGNVFLGAGDDSFLEQASAMLTGTVDGGDGTDTLVIDASGGGTVNGAQFVNFERFNQIGTGNVTYLGSFQSDTIGFSGGTVTVAADQTLSSNGATTLTGSDAAETVVNDGTIAGSVSLGGGNDQLINNGIINGSVALGTGDDKFVEGLGSKVAGMVDGGAGTDLYIVMLAGNRTGIGQRTGFEQLGIEGSGTLSLTLDQDFQAVALKGTSLNLSLAGHSVGAVTGSDSAETLAVDGDIASVSLGGGDDTLALGTTRATGSYDGGSGNNTLRFTAAGPVTLAGKANNFGAVALAGNALTVTGALGSAGTSLSFGTGDQSLAIAKGGTLAGTIDLGDGDDSFRLAAGATLDGTVNGGAGNDTAIVELAGNATLTSGLVGFERLATEGTGELAIGVPFSIGTVAAATDIDVTAGGSLTATQVQFGAGDNRFTIAGGFTGSIDGGAGNDTLAVSGGSEAAPIMFGTISNVETYGQTGGFARISGMAAFTALELTGGRLVGQAGSVITAPQILVRQGATFGSAGTVNGNITVAGTLSPGASPGTMTVNGNVTLASGSTSLFELSPTVSDKLVVNGSVSIGSGSTLQLVEIGTLRPGTSYTLITATNGITGGYTTVLKPADLFGFVVQRANEIDLLGEFADTGSFGPQVSRSIAYTNRTLEAQASTSALFNALPALLTSAGASNPQAFARLTPEPYASATQMGIDNALVLVDAARGPSFAAAGETPHAYTFGSALGQWHRLSDDQGAGTSAARTQGYGLLGGIGYGDAAWSVGAFGGYLNNRQTISALAARTRADGAVAGVQGRLRTAGGFGLNAAVIYDGGRATTTRLLPVGSANGRYDLHSWVGDVKASYEIGMSDDWALKPQVGITYLRTSRGGAAESGNSPFALTVARNRHVAGFADGAMAFGRGEASAAPFRPFVSLGVRYQIEGTRADALAGFAGGGLGLEALGAPRARLVGTASGGIAYRLKSGLDIFATAASQTGSDDHQQSISSGVRFRF